MRSERRRSQRGGGSTTAPVSTALRQLVWMHGAASLLLAGASVGSASAQQPATAAAPLVFDGVTVVDVERGTLLPGQRVVIVGNRIQAIEGGRGGALPAGAQVVDAQGKYLIPGLWDVHLHSHLNTEAEAQYPEKMFSLLTANGVTGIRDPGSGAPLEQHVEWRRDILAGIRVGPPRQLLAGPYMGWDMQPETDDVEGWKQLMDSLKTAGMNFIKLYPFTYTSAAAARQVGLPFGGHIHDPSITAGEASDSGMVIIDHINTSGGMDQVCLRPNADAQLCEELAHWLRGNGTWFDPTLAFMVNGPFIDGWPELKERVRPTLERFAKFVEKFWAGSPVAATWLHDLLEAGTSTRPAGLPAGAMSLAQRVGLPLLTGTDASSSNFSVWPPGFTLHLELAMNVAEGLTPLSALQAATLNPAKMLRGTDSLGTVAQGKLADLVLLDADPLADITNTTTIRAVVSNGRYFDRAALDGLLAQARASTPSTP